MFFFKKKKESQSKVQAKAGSFEKAFEERLGQGPTTYVLNKMAGGSDINAIRNLFDIMAAEIELRSRCKSPGFDYYYEKALSEQILTPTPKPKATIQVSRAFAASQLIGKERFLNQYSPMLKRLSENPEFMQFVGELRLQLSGQETTNTPIANRQIADYFYANKANERFPEVKAIVENVITYGKQASAHISIYYAMFLY